MTFGDGLELSSRPGTLELWHAEECFARGEGYRGRSTRSWPRRRSCCRPRTSRRFAAAARRRHGDRRRERAARWSWRRIVRLSNGCVTRRKPRVTWRRWHAPTAGSATKRNRRECFLAAAERETDPAQRGGLLWTAGERDEARAAFAKALEPEPESALAFELRCLLGNPPGPGHSDRAQVISALVRESLPTCPRRATLRAWPVPRACPDHDPWTDDRALRPRLRSRPLARSRTPAWPAAPQGCAGKCRVLLGLGRGVVPAAPSSPPAFAYLCSRHDDFLTRLLLARPLFRCVPPAVRSS